MTQGAEPIEIAMDFIKRINAGDVNALCELMTEGHIFQDALGKRFMGRETMRQGWTAYFRCVPDYKVHAEEFFQTKNVLAIFGDASGTYVGNASSGGKSGNQPSAENFWQVPAAWRAVVDGGLISEWRVYADNQPLRKLMGERVP
jgi:ketosteroid isomerase-like protein